MSRQLQQVVRSYAIPAVLFVIVWITMLGSSSGVGEGSIFPVLDSFALLGLIALGVAVTMIAGELDLSVASMAALAGMVAVEAQSLGLAGALVVGTAVGVVLGAIQGYCIDRFQISSIFFTIATLILLRGVALLIGRDDAILVNDPLMGDPLITRWGILSISILIALGVFVAVGVFLAYARPGRELHAVGGDRQEAAAAGVNVRRVLIMCFAMSGGCAALAGSIAAYKGGSGNPDAFNVILLSAVAAAVIGGIALEGGRGSAINVALGVAILASISAGIAARGASEDLAQLITGGLLVLVIGGEWATGRIDARRLRRRFQLTTVSQERPDRVETRGET